LQSFKPLFLHLFLHCAFQPKGASRKRFIPWIGTILSICVVFFCFLGYAMVASFSVAAPVEKAHWELMAWLYLTGMASCSLLAILFVVSIFRKRPKKDT